MMICWDRMWRWMIRMELDEVSDVGGQMLEVTRRMGVLVIWYLLLVGWAEAPAVFGQ
jgi:hypothetical protein